MSPMRRRLGPLTALAVTGLPGPGVRRREDLVLDRPRVGGHGGGGIGTPYRLPGDVDHSDDFHVWAAHWSSKGIVYRLDGRTVLALDKARIEQTRGP